MMSRECAALSDIYFSSDDSSSSEEDEKVKHKPGDLTDLCLMGKSARHISNSDSDVSDDLSPDDLSLRIVEFENALCNQDKLFCKIFHETKKLTLELKSASSKIASLRSTHDDMSAKLCDYTMIMVNYADLWLVNSHVASLLDGTRLELRELKARSRLLGACTSYPMIRTDLEASTIEIKDLKHRLDHASRYTVLTPPCLVCGSLKGKLFHATKENTELKQEVAYLTARLEKTILSEKMIEKDFSRVEESASKSTYKLGVGFQRCGDKGEKSDPKFIPSSTYHQEEKTIKSTKAYYPSNPKPSFNPKREVRKETPTRERKFLCAYFMAVLVTRMSFASGVKELRRCVLIMLETHVVMSPLIFCLVLILVFRLTLTLVLHLALLLVPCLVSLMDLTIAHMVLVHKRTDLNLDALVMAHVLIVVIVFRVGLVFLLEGLTLTLSRDTWSVHIFSVVAHVPLGQMVRCKGL
jgi:hypothetical protein